MAKNNNSYPAKLDIDYPPKSNRLTVLFRILLVIPILVVYTLLASRLDVASIYSKGLVSSLTTVTALMILFRQRYPKWWFDFNLELNRFATRVSSYMLFLTDKYPSTEDQQSVHLDIKYPDAKKDLNRFLPLVKWLLAIPHYIVLGLLGLIAIVGTIVAWVSILVTGKYPKSIFEFVVGVLRYGLRVAAYVTILATDEYPPFSLD